jgi:hypothetical protein
MDPQKSRYSEKAVSFLRIRYLRKKASISGGFRRVRWGDRNPFEKFFCFSPAKTNEKQVHTTSNASQNVFLAMIAPPFQNPRSATGINLD